MTFFTINDPEEAIQIKDATRKRCNFCVGASLSESGDEEDREEEEEETVVVEEPKRKGRSMMEKLQNQPPSVLKKALFWICGIESSLNKADIEGVEKFHHPDTSIDQDPFWSKVCDINAIFAIALSGFCIAFFNKY